MKLKDTSRANRTAHKLCPSWKKRRCLSSSFRERPMNRTLSCSAKPLHLDTPQMLCSHPLFRQSKFLCVVKPMVPNSAKPLHLNTLQMPCSHLSSQSNFLVPTLWCTLSPPIGSILGPSIEKTKNTGYGNLPQLNNNSTVHDPVFQRCKVVQHGYGPVAGERLMLCGTRAHAPARLILSTSLASSPSPFAYRPWFRPP